MNATAEFRLYAYALIEDGGRRLFLRRAKKERVAPLQWDAPGGGVEPGETLLECLSREIREECAVEAEIGPPIAVYSIVNLSAGIQHLMTVFEARFLGGEPRLSDEHSEWAWLTLDEAGETDLTDPIRAAVMKLQRASGKPAPSPEP